ncbi:MAG: 3-deoxy-7-phosphoheptulonate synthase class II [Steroidobacteraceae bacterium]
MTRNTNHSEWHPASWQARVALQQPRYADPDALQAVVGALSRLPPLVVSWEVENLRREIAAAQRGERFVLHGGDCAETLEDCESDVIVRKLKILLQMSLVLMQSGRCPVVRIARIAGQYAKPRSAETETRDGLTLPAFRGAIVNRAPFDAASREPDPQLLLRGYERAALTLNFIRALIDGGFADLHHPEYWDLGFVSHSEQRIEYQKIVAAIADSLEFLESVTRKQVHETARAEFFASHEGLLLHYEQAQTRFNARGKCWYNLSTHLPWIGMRTAQLGGAHVEYFRGIANPIAVKVGSAMDAEWLQQLVTVLNPNNVPGRLTLIHRYGAGQIADNLPAAIEAVRATGQTVLWVCDPMHGNTETTAGGYKTRRFQNILSELEQAFEIHRACGSRLGGVHIELTGDDVTECTGGARGLSDADLKRAYRSTVDPRLNYEQALELALRIGRHLRETAPGRSAAYD